MKMTKELKEALKNDLPKLPAVRKTKWVTALRSGKFVQGDGYLWNHPDMSGDDPIQHCCLGVLGEVCRVPVTEMDQQGMLSSINKLSLLSRNQRKATNLENLLAAMNDGNVAEITPVKGDDYEISCSRHSFKQIANFIERYL